MELTIITTEAERREMRDTLNAYASYIDGDTPKEVFLHDFPRKVWVDTEECTKGSHLPFTVVDNREGECFCEDFATLDGALLYATDVYTTPEHQETWDYMGAVRDGGDIVDRLEEGK